MGMKVTDLLKLIRELDSTDIRGRLIIIPALNSPAAMAGRRTSPIDKGNLNRIFPGDAGGSPTWMIADFVERELIPLPIWPATCTRAAAP